MATSNLVIHDANGDTPALGGLFNGKRFFLVQRLPSRSRFVDKVKSNGGEVVSAEVRADYIIADHLRRDCPAGSTSYTFIDNAINNGVLPDPNEHRAGATVGSTRPVGSVVPAKGTRTPFSREDDRALLEWVDSCTAKGMRVKGNDIYKHLEAQNPRHTFQGWRARYVKHWADKPRALPQGLTADDEKVLMENAVDIENIADDRLDEAWDYWARANPQHPAEFWRKCYTEKIRPLYYKQLEEQKQKGRGQSSPWEEKEGPWEEVEGPARTSRGLSTNASGPLKRKQAVSATDATPGASSKRPRFESPIVLEDSSKREGHQTAAQRNRMDGISRNQVSKDADQQDDEAGGEESGVQQLPTSELNRAAQAQLEQEQQRSFSDIDPQVREPAEDVQSKLDEQTPISGGRPRDETSSKQSSPKYRPWSPRLGVNETSDEEERIPGGDILNEHNLASQQLQHRPPQLRAPELREDNEDVDRSEFINALQGMVEGRSHHLKMSHAAARPPDLAEEEESEDELEESVPRGQEDRKSASQETPTQQFETQVKYPDLRYRNAGVSPTWDSSQPNDRMEHVPTGRSGRPSEASRPQRAVLEGDPVSSPSSTSSSNEGDAASKKMGSGVQRCSSKNFETQGIFDAETQDPDLMVPPPPESDESDTEMQEALPESQKVEEENIIDYIDDMKMRDYAENDIIRALKRTSMRKEHAELVLLQAKAGRGFPSDIPGIWSKKEDRKLEGGDARWHKRLEDKHGGDEKRARMEYLQEWRGDDPDSEDSEDDEDSENDEWS